MKKIPFIALAVVFALSGCALFKEPSSQQRQRHEQNAAAAETRKADFDQQEAIDNRAASYQRQGMSESAARAAAQAEATGPRRSQP